MRPGAHHPVVRSLAAKYSAEGVVSPADQIIDSSERQRSKVEELTRELGR